MERKKNVTQQFFIFLSKIKSELSESIVSHTAGFFSHHRWGQHIEFILFLHDLEEYPDFEKQHLTSMSQALVGSLKNSQQLQNFLH